MRILFDSKNLKFKSPFGTLLPGQKCILNIHIPAQLESREVRCVLNREDGIHYLSVPMERAETLELYEVFRGSFALPEPGLFFYYFEITAKTGPFRLFKYGDDTNMEDGACWQVSCVPADFYTPQWSQGAVIYQVFPDRFHKAGTCDLTGKLTPYTLHENWEEEVSWQPTKEGLVLNNDFYGGNFAGIREKLPYLASLGVDILYLNPISKSFSSHRYDTGDYKTPDPMLGTMADFTALCDDAHKLGMRVILDGVYSHTGSDSLYFNKLRSFAGNGAYNSKNSPYYNWYTFYNWPNSYNSWWGFDTLPTVNKLHPDFMNYIIHDEDSVVAHWLKAGCDGFRLDVADELPSEFLFALKQRIREIKPDALLMGEVWEDASNKSAYGRRCRYFVDGTLDSVMNYPFRTAILNFLRGQDDGRQLKNTVMTIAENYPPQVLLSNMNLLGTHDTPRILTALIGDFEGSREQQARHRLSEIAWEIARRRLLLATVLQYTLPGSPSIYYGDEAGMEGCKDPFNRRTFPWGKEDKQLTEHFAALGMLRKENAPLRLGDIRFTRWEKGQVSFTRSYNGKSIQIYVNYSDEDWQISSGNALLSHKVRSVAPDRLQISPMGYCILEDNDGI